MRDIGEPSEYERRLTEFEIECRLRLNAHPIFSRYPYATDAQIREFAIGVTIGGLTADNLAGRVFVDIGGGRIGENDPGLTMQYVPWKSVIACIMGMRAVNLDRAHEEQTLRKNAELSAALRTLDYTHIPTNLAQGLLEPTIPISLLARTIPDRQVDIIGCFKLTSYSNTGEVSPAFRRALKSIRPVLLEDQSDAMTQRIIDSAEGVMTVARAMLPESGLLFFNNRVFRKQDDEMRQISGGVRGLP